LNRLALAVFDQGIGGRSQLTSWSLPDWRMKQYTPPLWRKDRSLQHRGLAGTGAGSTKASHTGAQNDAKRSSGEETSERRSATMEALVNAGPMANVSATSPLSRGQGCS